MLFTPRPTPNLPGITFDGVNLEWVKEIKYLGLIIDNRLSFASHVDSLCSRLSKLQGISYSLSTFVPRDILLNIYYSLVYSLVIQNIVIWGGVANVHAERVNVILNKILRIILDVKFENYRPLTPTTAMYTQLELLKFKDIYKLYLLKFFLFLRNDKLDFFIKYFGALLPDNSYNLRNDRINLPDVRTDVEKRFTIFKCCEIVREVPVELLQPQSIRSLNRNFKVLKLASYEQEIS